MAQKPKVPAVAICPRNTFGVVSGSGLLAAVAVAVCSTVVAAGGSRGGEHLAGTSGLSIVFSPAAVPVSPPMSCGVESST